MKETPKVSTQRARPSGALLLSEAQTAEPASSSCGALVARALTSQRALNPLSSTLLSSGRNLPANDGCGQGEVSSTLVNSAIGANASSPVPTSSSSTCAASGSCAAGQLSATAT